MPRKVLEDTLKELSAEEQKGFGELVNLYKPEVINKYKYEKWNGIIGGTEIIFDEVYNKHMKVAIKDKLHEGKGKAAHAKALEHLILESLRATKDSDAMAVAKVLEAAKKEGKYKDSVDDLINDLYSIAQKHLGVSKEMVSELATALEKSSDPSYKRTVIRKFTESLKGSVIDNYRFKRINKETVGKEMKWKAYLVSHNEKKGFVPDSYSRTLLDDVQNIQRTTSQYLKDEHDEKLSKEVHGYKKMTADDYHLSNKKATK